MKLPWVKRSVLAETEEQLRDLGLEYQNYRRRTANTELTALDNGRAKAALTFLPVYDNLLRALNQPCADEAYVEGIRLTMRSLQAALSELGIREIPALGETFDPNLHEALDHITDEDVGENIITSVALTGFRQGDIIIRHALVTVAN